MVVIRDGAPVYLDSSTLIYITEGNASLRESLDAFFAQALDSRAQLLTSELAIAEVLVHPLRNDDRKLIEAYSLLFERFVRPLPIERAVLVRAAELRATMLRIRMPDAIHLATAETAHAELFVTGDEKMPMPATLRRFLVRQQ